jgi:uronate dehydrogenase
MTPFTQPKKLKILITGAAGNIGMCLRTHLRGRYALVRLADIAEQEPAQENEEICQFDVRDPASIERCMKDIDCVVHLAGIPGADTWEKILPMNIEGCYNVFEAARRCGVRRVVFASSNHAFGYHRRE